MSIDKEVLYNITMPFGLLKEHHPEIAQALEYSGGPWEFYGEKGWIKFDPTWKFSSVVTYRLTRPEPPMTTGNFLTAVVGSVTFETSIAKTRLAVTEWSKGNYDEALRLIGHTPEDDE